MWDLKPNDRPLLLLAPMQEVTDLPFMKVMAGYGGADIYVTEYFRVHVDSRPEKHILRSIDENPTGRPVIAQMIGHVIPDLVRTVRLLEQHSVSGIDLNLGCPAPVVCRKCAGGGLLREPEKIDAILGALSEAVTTRFTVKTRLGYETPEEFDALLDIFSKHNIAALSIHGRTVHERYRTPIHPEWIQEAVKRLRCPVFANGNVVSVETGRQLAAMTGAAGLMIGRGAVRNPWLFQQLRASFANQPHEQPALADVYEYIKRLFEATKADDGSYHPSKHVQKTKKYLIFIAQGIDPEGQFEHRIRRVSTEKEFWGTCDQYLTQGGLFPEQPPESSSVFCGFRELMQSCK
mgnify:CR=1 FL=1|jgi:tRNA-dihydrouridine synthase C